VLAMVVNDNAGNLTTCVSLAFFASKARSYSSRQPKQGGIFIYPFDLASVLIRRGRCARIPRSNTARWPSIRSFS
jgi:hypothetical protein